MLIKALDILVNILNINMKGLPVEDDPEFMSERSEVTSSQTFSQSENQDKRSCRPLRTICILLFIGAISFLAILIWM